jgi:type IV pilus assembly protein PilM
MAGGSNLVGLDIGSTHLKVSLIKEGRTRHRLVNFGIKPLPQETIVDRHIMNAQAVVDALKELFSEKKLRRKDVAISISGHSVIIKKIEMPLMRGEELEEQARWEAEQYIPYNINDVELDYQVLQRRPTEGAMDLLLVAAKKDEIVDYVDVVTRAGLRPHVIDIDAFAMQNAFEMNYGSEVRGTVALVDIGASLTRLNIVRDGVTMFIRDISGGGQAITEEIRKELGITYEEAESYKVGASHPASADVIPIEVNELLEKSGDSLAAEIQRSIDFYLATVEGQTLVAVFLAGGAANSHYIGDAIARRSGVPVQVLNAFRQVQIDPSRYDEAKLRAFTAQAVVSVGLSARKRKEKKPQ